MQRLCHHCGNQIDMRLSIGRRDACLRCSWDLHCCRNCDFYARGYQNDCSESQAERQVDKEVGNFCDFFRFTGARSKAATSPQTDTRDKLDALFRKK